MPAAAPLPPPPPPPPHASVAASLAELAAAMQEEWKAPLSGGAPMASGGGAGGEKGGDDDDAVRSAVARCVRALADAADATAAEQTTADGGRPVDVRRAFCFCFSFSFIVSFLISRARKLTNPPGPSLFSQHARNKKKTKKTGRRRRARVGARCQAGSRRGASRPSRGRAVDLCPS